MIDAAGDDDLVEGRRLFPAIIAVATSRRDRRIFAIALADEPVIEAARARRERRNDFNRPEPVGQVAQQGRLVAGAGSDFEHFVAGTNIDRARHAAHGSGRRDADAEADVEIMSDVGLRAILRQHEFLARRHEKGALVGAGPEIVESKELLITVEALIKEGRILAAVRPHPGDEGGARRHRWPEVRRERPRHIGAGRQDSGDAGRST